jgi:hypothetical protein
MNTNPTPSPCYTAGLLVASIKNTVDWDDPDNLESTAALLGQVVDLLQWIKREDVPAMIAALEKDIREMRATAHEGYVRREVAEAAERLATAIQQDADDAPVEELEAAADMLDSIMAVGVDVWYEAQKNAMDWWARQLK